MSATDAGTPAGRRDAIRKPWRLALAAGWAALAVAVLLGYRALTAEQHALLDEARRLGTVRRQPEVERALRREIDPERCRLLLAQALLVDELDRRWTSELSPAARAVAAAEGLGRLERAVELAAVVLARRPASWRAAMILGAGRYLRQARERDARPWAQPAAWEAPLRAAIALAPTQPEPPRLLALVRLDTWFTQSSAERDETRGLLEAGFTDPVTFALLLDPWLRSARDPADALALLPADPEAYGAARAAYAQRSDWPGFLAADAARQRSLEGALAARLERAHATLAPGIALRSELLRLVAAAPVDLRFAPFVERVLDRCPAGPNDPDLRGALEDWLRLGLASWQRGAPALGSAALGRLAAAVGDLAAPEAALVALATGDLPEGERIERRSAGVWTDEWAPYLIAKARLLAERDPRAALDAIQRVPARSAQGVAYWSARATVAGARRDGAGLAAAAAALAALRGDRWPATAWRYRAGQAFLELDAARPAPGLTLHVPDLPPRGACLAFRLDGRVIAALAVLQPAVVLTAPLAAGPHTLEVVQLAGPRALPGDLALLPPAPAP